MDPVGDAPADPHAVIEWGTASVALGAEGPDGESGDLFVIVSFAQGALVAVIDGLGHGPEAALAARKTAELIEHDAAASVTDIVQRCHEGLHRTRGVVMTLASFDGRDSSITWVGVGNVEGVLLRADPSARPRREAIAQRSGVIGYQLPPLRPATLSLSPGDTLIMTTDGIRSGFASAVSLSWHPQETADRIMVHYRKGSDDALVAVARYVGATL